MQIAVHAVEVVVDARPDGERNGTRVRVDERQRNEAVPQRGVPHVRRSDGASILKPGRSTCRYKVGLVQGQVSTARVLRFKICKCLSIKYMLSI